jgi:predicted CXXCH cytochrome family protein
MRVLGAVLVIACTVAAQAKTVCAPCHPKQTARFEASAMGRSVGLPEPVPGGRTAHAASGSVLSSVLRGGRIFHVVSEREVTAEYPVALQIGRGVKAKTYAVQVGDYLLESPLSWYRSAGWDASPGYEAMPLIDFDRPVTENCLFCHADAAKASDSDGRRIATSSVGPITCERCHGPAELHLKKPARANIVNPARLSGPSRDSVCEQCHLEGETRTLNPGKTLWDYHPGQPLEQTVVTWILRKPNQELRAVTQAEELAESQCAQKSAGRLWCGTCHDPHGDSANRATQMTRVCTSCHATLSSAVHRSAGADCVRCHMPARPANNIAHLAVTDHRLRRPGAAEAPNYTGPETLVPWRDAPAEFRQRDLALAQLQVSSLAAQGARLLETLPESQQNSDPDVLSALEAAFLESTAPAKAVALSKWAVDAVPGSATFALNHGLALKRAGNTADAERELLRAIDLDPSLMQAYAQLAVLYDSQGKATESRAIIGRFLRWNPQNIQFRIAQRR